MEIDKVQQRQDVAQPPPAQPVPPPQWNYKDVLVSVGTTAGWGLWVCTSFICRKSWALISSWIWKGGPAASPANLEDLLTPQKFRATFKDAPFSVIIKILDAIQADPITAEKLLVMIAQDCKDNPDIYSPYRGDVKQCYGYRKEWIMRVDEIVTQCILSPNHRTVEEKVLMGEIEGDEAGAISVPDHEWNDKAKTYSESAREFRRIYDEVKKIKADFAVVWSTLFFQLADDLPHLDLLKDATHVNPVPKEGKTFGLFLERLLFKMDVSPISLNKLTNFLNRATFDQWADYTTERLRFALIEKSTAQMTSLCKNLIAILDDKQKRTTLFNIVARVIGVLRPIGEVREIKKV